MLADFYCWRAFEHPNSFDADEESFEIASQKLLRGEDGWEDV